MFKKIVLGLLVAILYGGVSIAATGDTVTIIYGIEKAKVINGSLQVTTTGSNTINIGTIAAFAVPIWTTTPPTKVYEFTINLNPLATSSTLFTIGTPVANHKTFIEYISIIRDEQQPLDYLNFQLINIITGKLLIGREIVPAYTDNLCKPTVPLLATDLQLLLRNKSNVSQLIKISVMVSVRKANDPIYGMPY
ncbi:hypothetical protein COY26_00975 [Candidatus Woesearchaeota archaeon CG_4_10_14_0_2_um_filter_33_10]|nr:MAG: hypothetical protein COY26_00975 [Candidatus Woesearchaeota archaeon CG_4_10_14_0_2_um_filter_33_10]